MAYVLLHHLTAELQQKYFYKIIMVLLNGVLLPVSKYICESSWLDNILGMKEIEFQQNLKPHKKCQIVVKWHLLWYVLLAIVIYI